MPAGPGKKKCPKCNKEFGQAKRKCDKPGCEYIFPLKNKKVEGDSAVSKSKKRFNKAEYAKAAVLYALNISGKKGYERPAESRPTDTELVAAIKISRAESERLAAISDEWDVYECANKLSESVRKDIDKIMKEYE